MFHEKHGSSKNNHDSKTCHDAMSNKSPHLTIQIVRGIVDIKLLIAPDKEHEDEVDEGKREYEG